MGVTTRCEPVGELTRAMLPLRWPLLLMELLFCLLNGYPPFSEPFGASIGVTGCDERGPLEVAAVREVDNEGFNLDCSCGLSCTGEIGDSGGVTSLIGLGILVPSVSEYSTGSMERNGRREVLERWTLTEERGEEASTGEAIDAEKVL